MKNYGKGYIEQERVADRFVVITWDNGSSKFCGFRIDLQSNEWTRTHGNHNKKLPAWVISEAKK